MTPSFRNRLLNHEPLLGTLITLPSPEVAEILAEAGFDWLFIDLEHSPLGPRDAQTLVQAAGRAECVIRIPLNDEAWIKKALDTGAAGVMVPQVNTEQEARRAVRSSKYPPQGTRSVGMARAHGYGARFQEYMDRANAETVVIVQVEHIRAVENIEAILQVEGIDAVLIGPYDLSASLNRTGQIDHAEVQAAISRVGEACAKKNVPLGIFTASPQKAAEYLREGYSLLAVGGDAILLAQSAKAVVGALRGAG